MGQLLPELRTAQGPEARGTCDRSPVQSVRRLYDYGGLVENKLEVIAHALPLSKAAGL